MPIKTSLRSEVLDSLPVDKKGRGIYHRPQVGSAIYLKGGPGESINRNVSDTTTMNGKKVLNTHSEFRTSEWESPHINALKAFEAQPTMDNFYQTRRLVLTYNHGTSRRDYDRIGEYRIAYYETLASCNMCYFCKRPLKVRRARITEDSRKPKDSFFAVETPETKLEKRKDGGKRIRSVAGEPLSGLRYKPHSPANNVTYGDIKSHFEYRSFRNEQGEMRYRFIYVDGSGKRIEQRKRKNGVKYFVEVSPDKTTETEIIPRTSYRVTSKQCKCKKDRHK